MYYLQVEVPGVTETCWVLQEAVTLAACLTLTFGPDLFGTTLSFSINWDINLVLDFCLFRMFYY